MRHGQRFIVLVGAARTSTDHGKTGMRRSQSTDGTKPAQEGEKS
jgi:hypothetical protein